MDNPFERIEERLARLEKLIVDFVQVKIENQGEQDIVPIEEAMKITNLARQTLYGKVYDRKIPFIKRPGSRKLLFSKSALIKWLQEEEP